MVVNNSLIDIIIPVYNAKETLLRTLCSVALQKKFHDFKVYLVVDADNCNYDYEVDFVKEYMDITLYRLDNNVGPGQARQYGINNSNSPYIMFIDSDDYLYNPYVLYEFYQAIKEDNYDNIVSNFIYQRDNEVIVKKLDSTWLHGKVYNRLFLENNDICFNETRANEDNGFNRLIIFNNPKTKFIDKITYVYSENSNSITRRDNREYKYTALEDYCYNIYWAISKAVEKKKSLKKVAVTSYAVLYSMYYYYNELYEQYDVSKLFLWSKKIYLVYEEYKNLLEEKDINLIQSIKDKEYKDKNIKFYITFKDFLDKVSDSND